VAGDVTPYPEAPKGTKYRVLPDFPYGAPERAPKPMTATRTDGKVVDLLATIGERPRAAQPRSPDELVGDWRPVE
jgi:hypothetical protein